MPTGPQRRTLLNRGAAMFSAIERCGSSACSRSAGTSTTPARIASYGCRARSGVALDEDLPAGRRCWPESTSKSSSWPCASSAAIPRISPGRSAKETSLSVSPTCSPRTSSAVRSSTSSIRSRSGVASATPAARATSSPSMNSTIFSSPPSCGTSVPTSPPSRSTVARSQCAITSRRRWVMKSAERPLSFWRRITSKTRSARSAGSAAVISSRIRSCGSRASARARSIIRSSGSGTSTACSSKSISRSSSRRCRRTSPTDVPVSRRFCAIVRSGTSAGSWKTGASPIRAACAGEETLLAAPLTRIVPPSGRITPVSTFTSVLLPAPFAPSRACTSPGLDDERRRPQRDDGAVALRHLACGQEAHAWVREGAPGGAPSLFARGATAPCSP